MPVPEPSTEFPPNFPLSERLLNEPCILGIDEAGRGPVLGPLVYGIFICPLSQLSRLKTLGVADSKALTLEDRESIFRSFVDDGRFGWFTRILTPLEISKAMLSEVKYNLNELSYDTVYGLIERVIAHNVQIEHVYVDTLGKADKYRERLLSRFPNVKFTVAPKADALYPTVSAASIVAKVTRDDCISRWVFTKEPRSRNYGCGYPGDATTVAWLHDNVHPLLGYDNDFVRFSWASCQAVLDKLALPIEIAKTEEPTKKVRSGMAEICSAKHVLNF